eukprot:6900742-Pyramimonas_sp.AAC.1
MHVLFAPRSGDGRAFPLFLPWRWRRARGSWRATCRARDLGRSHHYNSYNSVTLIQLCVPPLQQLQQCDVDSAAIEGGDSGKSSSPLGVRFACVREIWGRRLRWD